MTLARTLFLLRRTQADEERRARDTRERLAAERGVDARDHAERVDPAVFLRLTL